jgi:hypothetical protein
MIFMGTVIAKGVFGLLSLAPTPVKVTLGYVIALGSLATVLITTSRATKISLSPTKFEIEF